MRESYCQLLKYPHYTNNLAGRFAGSVAERKANPATQLSRAVKRVGRTPKPTPLQPRCATIGRGPFARRKPGKTGPSPGSAYLCDAGKPWAGGNEPKTQRPAALISRRPAAPGRPRSTHGRSAARTGQ